MHGWEMRMLLKHYLERGVSKAALSRRFGVSRRTIHAWVETGQLDRNLSTGGARYAPRSPAPHKLAPYTGIIEARLEEFPGLSAQRLFDEVRAAGYPGGYSRVRDYVRAVRPREPTESVVRFETPAGRQGQVDFATFTLPWGRRHALVVVLTEGLERAFARFGGVPTELLFDQMRAVVLSDGRVGGGELVLNAACLRFAAHWGFHPRACRPYRAQTKGKVERPRLCHTWQRGPISRPCKPLDPSTVDSVFPRGHRPRCFPLSPISPQSARRRGPSCAAWDRCKLRNNSTVVSPILAALRPQREAPAADRGRPLAAGRGLLADPGATSVSVARHRPRRRHSRYLDATTAQRSSSHTVCS